MSINKIQFQTGLSLVEFLEKFPDENPCRSYLRKQKWPQGFCCKRCSYKRSSLQLKGIREVHECLNCFYEESLIAHTLFERTHLPLRRWFLAIQLLTQAKTCMSAMELHRHLQVNIKTARLLKHKIMQTLSNAEENRVLEGRIECNEVYLGAVHTGIKTKLKPERQVPIIAAIQTDLRHHPELLVLNPLKELIPQEIDAWSKKHLSQSCCVFSNNKECFKALDNFCEHRTCTTSNTGGLDFNEECKWAIIVLRNVTTSFSGALHAFKFRKYGQRYLGNMQFRFNHRFDLKACFYEVLNNAISSPPKPAKFLYSYETG